MNLGRLGPRRRHARLSLIVSSSVALLLVGCGQGSPGPDASGPTQGAAGQTSAPPAPRLLWLDLDGARGSLDDGAALPDRSGHGNRGLVHLAGPAPLPLTAAPGQRPGDVALRFPAKCSAGGGADCPKAIIEVADAPELTPGGDDFAYGATLRLESDQTSKGSNVVQKGYSLGGRGQWKLQVDGEEGLPSCVLVGTGEAAPVKAVSTASVADGRWHAVECRRAATSLAILVDGTRRGRADLPPDLVIAPEGSVRIGGKNLDPDNDQFFGEISDVSYSIPEG